MSAPKTHRHGTVYGYKHAGCRCGKCKTAMREAWRRIKRAQRARESVR